MVLYIVLAIILVLILLFIIAYINMPKVKYYTKAVVFFTSYLFVSLGGAIIILLSKLTPYKQDGSVIRPAFSKLWQRTAGIKIEIEGEEYLKVDGKGTRPCVFMYNHQSTLDVLMICTFFPKKSIILCKKSLKKYPIFGQYLQVTGAYFLDRKNSTSAIETMKKAAQYIKKRNLSVLVAPEGTRSKFQTPDLLPFKKGGFHLAIQAQCPIVPIVIPNYPVTGVYDDTNKTFDGGKLKLKVLPPISVEGLTSDDVNSLVSDVRGKMLDALKELTIENELLNQPKKNP